MKGGFKKGQRVAAGGRPGEVIAVAAYAELYPENVRAAAASGRPRKTPADPESVVVAVLLDGEERPRNFPADQVTKE